MWLSVSANSLFIFIALYDRLRGMQDGSGHARPLFVYDFFTEWVVFILLSREGINILIMGFSMQEVCHSCTGSVFHPPSLPPSLPPSR